MLPIRWIVDDAVKFTAREERRGSRYDGIILDPPKYGRGPKGEVWDLFRDLPRMLDLCCAVLVEKPDFVIVTAYAIRASYLAVHELCRQTSPISAGPFIGRAGGARGGLRSALVDIALFPLERDMKRRFDRRASHLSDQRTVTSLTNQSVKDIRALSMRKVREEAGLFIAEGLKLVADAIDGGWPIRILVHRAGEERPMLAKAIQATRHAGGEVLEVTAEILEKLSRRDNPQTVLGVFAQRLEPLRDLRLGEDGLWIGLDRVRDPGNLGTIIRTADAVGAEGVMLIGETTDPFGIEAVRATMGSIFNIRLAAGSALDFLAWRRGFAGEVVGTHLSGSIDYRVVTYTTPSVLLMGNEQQGLPDDLATACDRLVKIPMAGRADSLNLAVATGVMLFEMRRARLKA